MKHLYNRRTKNDIYRKLALLTYLYYSANIGRNETNRILPFNIWLNAPIWYMTPYFEIEFIIQVLRIC